MKKIVLAMVVVLSSLGLDAKTLVAYYSYTNNIGRIVTDLRSQIDCDVIEIQPAEKGLDYAANNYAIGTQLLNSIRANPDDASSYPDIDEVDVDLAGYDMVIIACPLWWSQMAAPFQTFLFHYGPHMAGKNIGMIVSSASSGISGVVADARRLIPDGKFVEPNLWIRSSQTSNCHSLISQWLTDIDYKGITSGGANVTVPGNVSLSNNLAGLCVNGDFNSVSMFNMAGVKVVETTDSYISTSYMQPGLYALQINTSAGNRSYKIRLK